MAANGLRTGPSGESPPTSARHLTEAGPVGSHCDVESVEVRTTRRGAFSTSPRSRSRAGHVHTMSTRNSSPYVVLVSLPGVFRAIVSENLVRRSVQPASGLFTVNEPVALGGWPEHWATSHPTTPFVRGSPQAVFPQMAWGRCLFGAVPQRRRGRRGRLAHTVGP